MAGAAVAGLGALSSVGQAGGRHRHHKEKEGYEGIPIGWEELNDYGEVLEKWYPIV